MHAMVLAVVPEWVFAIPLLTLVPWALLDSKPGISVAGGFQAIFILGIVFWSLSRLWKRPSVVTGLVFGLSYPFATLISNAAAFVTMRNLLH